MQGCAWMWMQRGAEEQELEQGGLADTLKEIVGRTMPSPRYVRFHEAHVQRYLSRLKAFPPRCGSSLTLLNAQRSSLSVSGGQARSHVFTGVAAIAVHSSWCFSARFLTSQRSTHILSLTVLSIGKARGACFWEDRAGGAACAGLRRGTTSAWRRCASACA